MIEISKHSLKHVAFSSNINVFKNTIKLVEIHQMPMSMKLVTTIPPPIKSRVE